MMLQQVEGAAQAGQHAERQHIDLEDADRVEVVLVPLDHLALGHRRLDDRHDLVEPVLGDDEAADMLGEMTREAEDLVGAVHDMARARVGPVEAAGLGLRLAERLRRPAPDRA